MKYWYCCFVHCFVSVIAAYCLLCSVQLLQLFQLFLQTTILMMPRTCQFVPSGSDITSSAVGMCRRWIVISASPLVTFITWKSPAVIRNFHRPLLLLKVIAGVSSPPHVLLASLSLPSLPAQLLGLKRLIMDSKLQPVSTTCQRHSGAQRREPGPSVRTLHGAK